MREKHYAAAQEKFEQALGLDETLAEAHNNLAFSLRQQGRPTSRGRYSITIAPGTQARPGAGLYVSRCAVHPDGRYGSRPHRPRAAPGLTRSWPPGLNASSLAPTDATPMTTWQGRLRGSSPKRLTGQRDRPRCRWIPP